MLWSQLKWVISFSFTPNKGYLYYVYHSGKLSYVIWAHYKADSGNRVSPQHPMFFFKYVCLKVFPKVPGNGLVSLTLWQRRNQQRNSQSKNTASLTTAWRQTISSRCSYCLSHDIKVPTVGKKTGRSFMKRKLNWKPSWASWHPCLISAGCL